jgi:hypothetical protein
LGAAGSPRSGGPMTNPNYSTYLGAATQLQRCRDLLAHAVAYALFNLVFVAVWLAAGRGGLWPAFPLIGWGSASPSNITPTPGADPSPTPRYGTDVVPQGCRRVGSRRAATLEQAPFGVKGPPDPAAQVSNEDASEKDGVNQKGSPDARPREEAPRAADDSDGPACYPAPWRGRRAAGWGRHTRPTERRPTARRRRVGQGTPRPPGRRRRPPGARCIRRRPRTAPAAGRSHVGAGPRGDKAQTQLRDLPELAEATAPPGPHHRTRGRQLAREPVGWVDVDLKRDTMRWAQRRADWAPPQRGADDSPAGVPATRVLSPRRAFRPPADRRSGRLAPFASSRTERARIGQSVGMTTPLSASPVRFEGSVANIARDCSMTITSAPPGPPRRIDGYTIGAIPTVDGPGPHGGEVHPDGDEFLYVVRGTMELILDDGDERAVGVETMGSTAVRRRVRRATRCLAPARTGRAKLPRACHARPEWWLSTG